MLKEDHLVFFRSYGVLVARILMGAFFLISGVNKLMDAAGTASYIASGGFPESIALAYLVGLFEVLAGAALIFGKKMAEAALLLAVFALVISFPYHGPQMWDGNPMQQTLFMKNMAIIAGLLYIVAYAKRGSSQTQEKPADPVGTL